MLLIVVVISAYCRKFYAIRTHRPTLSLYQCAAADDVPVEILVLLFSSFLASRPNGRARGRARTKIVGPKPYLVYSCLDC